MPLFCFCDFPVDELVIVLKIPSMTVIYTGYAYDWEIALHTHNRLPNEQLKISEEQDAYPQ